MRHHLARTVVAATLATGLVSAGSATQSAQAAGSTTLQLTHSKVMKNEYIGAYGEVSGGERVVKLQFRTKNSGAWTTWRTEESTPEGYFGFEVRTTKNRYVRFYAPKDGSASAIVGKSRKVSVVGQTASAFVVPGSVCKGSWMPSVLAVASFKPARTGRLVRLTVDGVETNGYEDVNGRVALEQTVGTSSNGTKTVTLRADPYNGSSAKSVTATYKVVTCSG